MPAQPASNLQSIVSVKCPRGHRVDVGQTGGGWERIPCSQCGMLFAYLGDVRCSRHNNHTDRLRGKKRRFAVETTVTFRTPAGPSEQQRMVLYGIRDERRELVHVRQGHRFSCSEGSTGVYYFVNHTLGEPLALLPPISWTAVLLLIPIVLVAWITAATAADLSHGSIGTTLLSVVSVVGAVGALLYTRYRRRHAWPLRSSAR